MPDSKPEEQTSNLNKNLRSLAYHSTIFTVSLIAPILYDIISNQFSHIGSDFLAGLELMGANILALAFTALAMMIDPIKPLLTKMFPNLISENTPALGDTVRTLYQEAQSKIVEGVTDGAVEALVTKVEKTILGETSTSTPNIHTPGKNNPIAPTSPNKVETTPTEGPDPAPPGATPKPEGPRSLGSTAPSPPESIKY